MPIFPLSGPSRFSGIPRHRVCTVLVCFVLSADRLSHIFPSKFFLVFFIHPPIHPSIQPPTYLPIYPPIHPSIKLPTYLPTYPPIHPSIHPSLYPSIYLSIYLYIYLSVCPSVRLPTYAPTHPPTYLHLSISDLQIYLSICIYIYIYQPSTYLHQYIYLPTHPSIHPADSLAHSCRLSLSCVTPPMSTRKAEISSLWWIIKRGALDHGFIYWTLRYVIQKD